MNDHAKADMLAEMALQGQPMFAGAETHGGKLRDVLREIVDRFNGLNQAVPWGKIIQAIPLILQLLAGGGNWTAILAQIMAIFFPAAATP